MLTSVLLFWVFCSLSSIVSWDGRTNGGRVDRFKLVRISRHHIYGVGLCLLYLLERRTLSRVRNRSLPVKLATGRGKNKSSYLPTDQNGEFFREKELYPNLAPVSDLEKIVTRTFLERVDRAIGLLFFLSVNLLICFLPLKFPCRKTRRDFEEERSISPVLALFVVSLFSALLYSFTSI